MEHVTTLRSAGEDVDAIAARLDRRTEALAFTGPAADRFRTEMQVRIHRLRQAAQELQDTAATLTHQTDHS